MCSKSFLTRWGSPWERSGAVGLPVRVGVTLQRLGSVLPQICVFLSLAGAQTALRMLNPAYWWARKVVKRLRTVRGHVLLLLGCLRGLVPLQRFGSVLHLKTVF